MFLKHAYLVKKFTCTGCSDFSVFSQPVLFFMCMGNELFFCLLYIMHYIEEPQGEYQQAASRCLYNGLFLQSVMFFIFMTLYFVLYNLGN